MKSPMLCPFWANNTKVVEAVTVGGFQAVCVPYLDMRVMYSGGRRFMSLGAESAAEDTMGTYTENDWVTQSLMGGEPQVFWGDPKAARLLIQALKGRCEVYLWVVWQNWFGHKLQKGKPMQPLPKEAQFVDSRGTAYEITPCPHSDWQVKRMQRYIQLAKKLGCVGVVVDAENYASGRFTQYGGKEPRGGVFGQRTPPLCNCGHHAPQKTWDRIRPVLKKVHGQAFYLHPWVVDLFGGCFNEDYKDFDSARQVKEIDKMTRHGAYGGVWLSAMQTLERALDFVRSAVEVYGTRWWIWEEKWLQSDTPLDKAWWEQFREITDVG